MPQFSDSSTNEMIQIWRRARLACDHGKLAYPAINILHPEHGTGDDDYVDETSDADIVQRIVDKMPREIRTTFEAYHLQIIRGEYCRDKPHKWRALVLGIEAKQYFAREAAGFVFIHEHLLTMPQVVRD